MKKNSVIALILTCLFSITTGCTLDEAENFKTDYSTKDFNITEVFSKSHVAEFKQRGISLNYPIDDNLLSYDKRTLYANKGVQPYSNNTYAKTSMTINLINQDFILYDGATSNPNILSNLQEAYYKNKKIEYNDLDVKYKDNEVNFLTFENREDNLIAILPISEENKDLKQVNTKFVSYFNVKDEKDKRIRVAFNKKVHYQVLDTTKDLKNYLGKATYFLSGVNIGLDTNKNEEHVPRFFRHVVDLKKAYITDTGYNSLDETYWQYLKNNNYTLTLRDIKGDYEGSMTMKGLSLVSTHTESTGKTSVTYPFGIYKDNYNSDNFSNYRDTNSKDEIEVFDFKRKDGDYKNLLDDYTIKKDGTLIPNEEAYAQWLKEGKEKGHKYLLTETFNGLVFGVYDVTYTGSKIVKITDYSNSLKWVSQKGSIDFKPSYLLKDYYTEKATRDFGKTYLSAGIKYSTFGIYYVGKFSEHTQHTEDSGLVFRGIYELID